MKSSNGLTACGCISDLTDTLPSFQSFCTFSVLFFAVFLATQSALMCRIFPLLGCPLPVQK